MKNLILTVLLIVIIGVFALCAFNGANAKEGYLRIHIRAHSNSETDQTIKYAVKESISEFLTGLIENCTNANEAMAIVNNNLDAINNVATAVLATGNFNYGAKTKLTQEYFPTRSYDSLVLENGTYDALIVELGLAQGDNWWCVVYPPLCFKKSNDGKNYVKSILGELFK